MISDKYAIDAATKLLLRIRSIIGRRISPRFDFSLESLDQYAPEQGVGD
jgi:hypothetical protein